MVSFLNCKIHYCYMCFSIDVAAKFYHDRINRGRGREELNGYICVAHEESEWKGPGPGKKAVIN